MSENKKENSILSINSLLRTAGEETERKRSVSTPDFMGAAEAEIAGEAARAAAVPVKEAVTEEQEIINEYSGKEKTDPNMSTNRLKELLAAHAAEDTALLDYFSGGKPRAGKRVDDIYAILDSEQPPEEDTAPTEEKGGRLSDEVPEKETFVQEKLFSFGDTVQIEELPLDNGEKATFDADFAALSEKINSGEISIEAEDDSEDQLTLGIEEEDEQLSVPAEENDKDKKLRMIFDMMEEGEAPAADVAALDNSAMFKRASTASKAKKHRKKASRKKAEKKAFEYTDREQNKEIGAMLGRAVAISRLKLIGTVILTFLILYMELATNSSDRSPFLRPGRYGVIYVLADLQLLFFIIMLMGQSFINGLKAFSGFKLTADSVMAASMVAASMLCVVTLLTDPTKLDLQLYNLVAAGGACALALVKHLQCIKDLHCFRIIASKKPKFTTQMLSGGTGEAGEFYKYLHESSELFTVRKADFVSGFFGRTSRRPASEDIFNFLLPAGFVASVVLFLVSYLTNGDIYNAYSVATMLFCAATPITAFFMLSLPVITANLIARRHGAAFVGNAVAEEYADAAVLSFADTEAFQPHLVSITSVKTYGNYPIDKVITRLGMLFDYIEGPLKTVTARMLDKLPKPDSIRLIDSAADGLYIVMDGCDYYLGKRSYMRHCRLDAPVDETDEVYSRNVGSVMYMAINDSVVAKIYVKYGINGEFDELLRSMHRAGVCVGIKTLDPNINNELLQKSIRYKQCPVAILKGGRPEDMNATVDKVDSGIVSTSSLHNFLKMFILCDRARHATKSNCIINIAAMLVAMFVVFFLAVTGSAGAYGSGSVLLFQLLWLLPSLAISFLL